MGLAGYGEGGLIAFIPDRTTIEFFNGGHAVNRVGSFAFLRQHLSGLKPEK